MALCTVKKRKKKRLPFFLSILKIGDEQIKTYSETFFGTAAPVNTRKWHGYYTKTNGKLNVL